MCYMCTPCTCTSYVHIPFEKRANTLWLSRVQYSIFAGSYTYYVYNELVIYDQYCININYIYIYIILLYYIYILYIN